MRIASRLAFRKTTPPPSESWYWTMPQSTDWNRLSYCLASRRCSSACRRRRFSDSIWAEMSRMTLMQTSRPSAARPRLPMSFTQM